MAKSRARGSSRFGFVTMATTEQTQRCISELNGTELKGHKISVEMVRKGESAAEYKRVMERRVGRASIVMRRCAGHASGVEGGCVCCTRVCVWRVMAVESGRDDALCCWQCGIERRWSAG